MKPQKQLSYINVIACLFFGCNLDYAPEGISPNIAQSKANGFFLCEYKMDSVWLLDKRKTFVLKKVWLEKTHTSAMNAWGKESYQIDNSYNQVVFDVGLGDEGYYSSRNFNSWIIEGEKGELPGSENRLISIVLAGKSVPQRIRFFVFHLKSPPAFRIDTIKVAGFVLKKR